MKKSSIKPYEPTPTTSALRKALFKWRDECTVNVFNSTIFSDYSGHLILPLTILNRIVDCAQAGKLASLDNLKREITWKGDYFDQYGSTLLDIVHAYYPLPIASAPLAPSSSTGATSTAQGNDTAPHGGELAPIQAAAPGSTARVIRKGPTCGACHRLGHTRKH